MTTQDLSHDRLAREPMPTTYDGLKKHGDEVFRAITAVQNDMNRVKRDLARSKTQRRQPDPDWATKTRHALNCMKLAREMLTRRHGQVRDAIKHYRVHRFIDAARDALPEATFNAIMNATKRGNGRRANA